MSAAPPRYLVDAEGWVDVDVDVDVDVAVAAVDHVDHVPSPNQDERPVGVEPTLVVVHNISLPPGVFGGRAIDALFANTLDPAAHPFYRGLVGLRVSAHFLVRRSGAVVQFVACDRRAWHAGISNFEGRERCNDYSIGIELEGDDDSAFEDPQYASLIALVDALSCRYPLTAIAGHSAIAPGRKTDPGPFFDWTRLLAALAPSLRRPVI